MRFLPPPNAPPKRQQRVVKEADGFPTKQTATKGRIRSETAAVTRALISIANDLLSLPLTEAKAVEKTSTCEPAGDSIVLLTQRLAAGEEVAFIEFHQLYFDRLYHFLLVVTRGQEAEAQEALQLTLLRVIRYRRAFEQENAFWCWLKVLARSAARDAGRKQQRYQALLNRFSLWKRDRPAELIPHTDDQLHQSLDECLS